MITISCIIPSYNEAPRIKQVLDIISNHPLIHQIIVVDDGSKDTTREIVQTFQNITLVTHLQNKGKSAALATGLRASTGSYMLLLDADLIGLTEQNITDLISPVLNAKADITISLRRNSPKLWHMIGIDYISGERVIPRSLLMDHIDIIVQLPKFGIEVFMNTIIINKKYSIQIVQWPNVDSPFKYKKVGLWKGILGEIVMMYDIFRTVFIWRILHQIIKMRQLRIK